MPALHEECRPTTLDGVVGQPKAIATIRRLHAVGLGGRAFWISGRSGTGKTTIARIIASLLAGGYGATVETDSQDVTLDLVRSWEQLQYLCSFPGQNGETGRAFIINEAHRLRPAVVTRLLTALEPIAPRAVWIFTTTLEGCSLFEEQLDAGPLLSRCLPIKLETRGWADPAAEFAQQVAIKAGLDGKPIAAYKRLVNEQNGNLRGVLSAIEAGAMLAD